jgi:molecular chaperone HtpG
VCYACKKDKKFYDRVKGSLLIRLTDGKMMTYSEYLDAAKEHNENVVYYATDASAQAQYISMFKSANINVALFDKLIESQFATMLEPYMDGVKFVRVDAEIADSLKGDGEVSDNEELKALFTKVSANEKFTVKFDALKDSSVPALLNVSEESRRMDEMMKHYGMGDASAFAPDTTLVLNTSSPLIAKLASTVASDEKKAEAIASYIYKISLMSQKRFTADEMQAFIKDSFDILMQL